MTKFSSIILPSSSGYPPTCCWGGIHRSTTAFYRIHPRLKKPWYSAKADKRYPITRESGTYFSNKCLYCPYMRYHLSAPCVDLQTREIERRSTLRVRKTHGRSDV